VQASITINPLTFIVDWRTHHQRKILACLERHPLDFDETTPGDLLLIRVKGYG